MDDGCDVNSMDPALINRFLHIKIKPSIKDWIQGFARDNGISKLIMKFLYKNPTLLTTEDLSKIKENAFPTPRSWEMLSKHILDSSNIKSIRSFAYSIIGSTASDKLCNFIKDYKFDETPKHDPVYYSTLDPNEINQTINYMLKHEKDNKAIKAIENGINQDTANKIKVNLEKLKAKEDPKDVNIKS